jgi:hypothetical protein
LGCTWYRRHDECSNTGLCQLSRRIGRCRGGSGEGVLITGLSRGKSMVLGRSMRNHRCTDANLTSVRSLAPPLDPSFQHPHQAPSNATCWHDIAHNHSNPRVRIYSPELTLSSPHNGTSRPAHPPRQCRPCPVCPNHRSPNPSDPTCNACAPR